MGETHESSSAFMLKCFILLCIYVLGARCVVDCRRLVPVCVRARATELCARRCGRALDGCRASEIFVLTSRSRHSRRSLLRSCRRRRLRDALAAFICRFYSVIRFESVIHEFDPWCA